MQTLEISRDITETRRADEERARLYDSETRARAAAEAAINARDEFLAVVSHDLRNPLAAVSGNIQLMRRRMARGEVPTAEQLVERLDMIQRGVSALSRQVDELHDASLLQAGRQLDLRLQRTDLVALVRDYVRGLQNTSDSHRFHFHANVGELSGNWDSARLERVLSNLISNAIKYSPAGGEIEIHIGSEDNWAVLSVADEGLGIPAGELPHVFERFRRASNVVDRIAGSGLGLAGSRDIIEQHGGTISVQSQEGEGSTFTVRLPLGTAPASAP
jgi:signal transduction histidine kinase